MLKPLLLTLEGYTMYSDEWTKTDDGCRIDYIGDFYPSRQTMYVGDTEMNLPDFIAAVKPQPPIDLRERFIPCTEEQVDEVCDLLDALGCLPWRNRIGAKYWFERCKGVKVYPISYYLVTDRQGGYPTLTLEELREIANSVKL